jgi:uncharacterized damage-inducible protein DinB
MRLIDPLLMEFDRECSTTRKLLERVPEGKNSWQPHPKSMTLGRLAMHVATLPDWSASLAGDGFDIADPNASAVPEPPARASEIAGIFDDRVKAAKAALAALDDGRAMGSWTLSVRGTPMFSMPRLAVVRSFILNHSIHHRGQLSVYLRLLDVPLPPIYGPTADENPFG